MNCRTWIVALLAACLFLLTSPEAFDAAEEPGTVLSSDKDKQRVVEFLRMIIGGRKKADARAKNVLIKGRVSRLSVDWKQGMEPLTAATMPAPKWRAFSLVQRGDKRRFEMEYMQQIGKENIQETVYRLADGESFYKLDGNALEILGNKEGQKRWEDLAYEYYKFDEVYDGKDYGPVVNVCQKLIDRMTMGLDEKFWRDRVLRCSEEGDLLLVDNDDKLIDKSRDRSRFWVDKARGFRVVKSIRKWGGKGQRVDILEESHTELQEVIPKVFIDRKGMQFVSNIGSVAKRDQRAGWLKGVMEVTEVAVEDFQYDDKLFDWHTLPIPIGAHVTDHRSDPELLFNHGKSPIDEEILRSGLSNPPLRQRRRWPLVVSLVSFCAFAVLLVFRYIWRKQVGKLGPGTRP